jgi:solute carrier family 25 carnitine/acylcarnitine transporter 20/29
MHRKDSAMAVARYLLRSEGLVGLWRGVAPAVVGGTIYGGLVLSVYSGAYAACNSMSALAEPIPGTGGMRASVLLAGLASGVARSVIETPLAHIKVRQQTGLDWRIEQRHGGSFAQHSLRQIRELYRGSVPTLYRSCTMLGTFFVLNDSAARHLPGLNSMTVLGPFVKGGVCASVGWVAAWPFEVVKNRVQADNVKNHANKSVHQLLRQIVREEGVRGLFRGILPGLSKSFVSNGAAMIALNFTQRHLTCGSGVGGGSSSSTAAQRGMQTDARGLGGGGVGGGGGHMSR